MLQCGRAGEKDVRARHENADESFAKFAKVRPNALPFLGRQRRKARERRTLTAADGRRQSPHAAASGAQFRHFLGRKFDNSERRIRADAVKACGRLLAQPVKTVCMVEATLRHTGSFVHTVKGKSFLPIGSRIFDGAEAV
jgi:hypothetical protein